MKRMMNTRTAILPSTAPANGSSSLLRAEAERRANVPASWPTPPSTTTMNESTMYVWPSSGPTLPSCDSATPPSPAMPAAEAEGPHVDARGAHAQARRHRAVLGDRPHQKPAGAFAQEQPTPRSDDRDDEDDDAIRL